jgi:hypothetical protein
MPEQDWFADTDVLEGTLVPANDPSGGLPAIPDRGSFSLGPSLRRRDQARLDTYEARKMATIAVSVRLGFARDIAENMIEQMSLAGYLATLNVVYSQLAAASRNEWVYGNFARVANRTVQLHGDSIVQRMVDMRRTFDAMVAEGVAFSDDDERGLLEKLWHKLVGRHH